MASVFNRIGPYQVTRQIGAGSFSTVFLATDTRNDRSVVLKLQRTDGESDRVDARLTGIRLQRDFSQASNLVPQVYEWGTADGYNYVALEHVDGETLASVLRRGALSPSVAVAIALQIAQFLEAAHSFAGASSERKLGGFIHGDLKPDNVILTHDDTIRVIDFDIAKHLDESQTTTSTNWLTVQYAAPELLETGTVDRQSDLWALGVMLFEMLYGVRPFEQQPSASLERVIRARRLEIPTRAGIPEFLRSILGKLLAPIPEQRYRAAGEVAEVLALYLRGPKSGFETHPGNNATSVDVDPGSIVIIWDPDRVWPSDYAGLIEALGDLARASGAEGIRRVRHETFGTPVAAGALV